MGMSQDGGLRADRSPLEGAIAASVMSMPLLLERRRGTIWPTPVKSPAASRIATRRRASTADTASSRSRPLPCQASCCMTSSSRVSAAVPMPVPTPVSSTASQKRQVPGRVSVAGTMHRPIEGRQCIAATAAARQEVQASPRRNLL